MSNTVAAVEQHRLAYRPQVVELILATTRPQIQQATEEMAALQERVNGLVVQIEDRKKLIAELRQAERDVEASAELPVLHLPLQDQGDAARHAEVFGGPQTGVILPPGSFPETTPDGYCIHCGKPVWRVSITPASPKGARHAYGATCDPENPGSGVADLGDEAMAP
ncbi:hypothetical protein [Nonomuraea typhae]|uniref:Uncharacterized protein n=1 Tax=Nonomuraea typhae TaxID=2603600 RepID=A0ABW7YLR7_9ACTN